MLPTLEDLQLLEEEDLEKAGVKLVPRRRFRKLQQSLQELSVISVPSLPSEQSEWCLEGRANGQRFSDGSKPMGSVRYLSGDCDVHWGYGILTHGLLCN